MKSNREKPKENSSLILIPKMKKYMEYILNILVKIPRTEKYSIGNEYKLSMYKMIEKAMYLNKISSISIKSNDKKSYDKEKYLETLNQIDVFLNCQRIYLRIMENNHWIDKKKFYIAMEHIYEIGKIVGGLLKYYAKNNTK